VCVCACVLKIGDSETMWVVRAREGRPSLSSSSSSATAAAAAADSTNCDSRDPDITIHNENGDTRAHMYLAKLSVAYLKRREISATGSIVRSKRIQNTVSRHDMSFPV